MRTAALTLGPSESIGSMFDMTRLTGCDMRFLFLADTILSFVITSSSFILKDPLVPERELWKPVSIDETTLFLLVGLETSKSLKFTTEFRSILRRKASRNEFLRPPVLTGDIYSLPLLTLVASSSSLFPPPSMSSSIPVGRLLLLVP